MVALAQKEPVSVRMSQTYLELPVDGHADEGQAEETGSTIGNVLIILRQLLEVEDERRDPGVVVVLETILDVLLYDAGS